MYTTKSHHYGYDANGNWGLIETTYYIPRARAWDNPDDENPAEKLAHWESSAMRSKLVKAVQNGEDWHETIEDVESHAKKYPGSELAVETCNTSFLLAIREALKKEDFNLAWDVACCGGRNIDTEIRKGFTMTALAAERGYADIYFFLIEKMENPRVLGKFGESLMDWFDQGTEEYGFNENYQAIKQDLIRRGVKLHARNSGGGCCLLI